MSVVNASEVKRMNIKEFREKGFLQELNRQFLHPLGLALEVIVNNETGEEKLGGIWDYRDDPGGLRYGNIFGDVINKDQVAYVKSCRKEKEQGRMNKFGWIVQPSS